MPAITHREEIVERLVKVGKRLRIKLVCVLVALNVIAKTVKVVFGVLNDGMGA